MAVIPAEAGIQDFSSSEMQDWTPAFAGVTMSLTICGYLAMASSQ